MKCFVGIGSNLEEPINQVRTAIGRIHSLDNIDVTSTSSLYRSPPMGPAGQPDYINAVICIETQLLALSLLDALQEIERLHGRVRGGIQWGPRTLDLDILLYGEKTINDERLQVPHPGLHERAFVLYPLQEIAPDVVIPGKGQLVDLVARCPLAGLERLKSS